MSRIRRHSSRHLTAGTFISGLLVAISYVAMIVPLAVYHAAQVAAARGLKSCSTLLITVCLTLVALSFATGHTFFWLGAATALFWSPIVFIIVSQRARLKSIKISLLAVLIPLVLTLFLLAALPVIPDLSTYLDSLNAPLWKQLEEGSFENKNQTFENWKLLIENFKASPEFGEFAKVFSWSWWQKLLWLTYGSGSSLTLILVATATANLLLVNHAFEQVERYKGISAYILGHKASFDTQFVNLIATSGLSRIRGSRTLNHVLRHEKEQPKDDSTSSVRSYFISEPKEPNTSYFLGYKFFFEPNKGTWKLRALALPLPLVLLTIAILAAMVGFFGSPESIITNLPAQFGQFLSFASLISFMLLTLLGAQGILVLQQRVQPFVLLCVFIAFYFSAGTYNLGNPHLLLGIFGSIGLIDYVYDFRKIQKKEPVA